jgi:hypothetical protein
MSSLKKSDVRNHLSAFDWNGNPALRLHRQADKLAPVLAEASERQSSPRPDEQ